MTSPPSLGVDPEPQLRTGWLMQRAYRHARRRFSAGLAELELDAPHFGVLLALNDQQPLSQTQLAQRNNSDRTAMVRTLDDLERLGYVRRRQSAQDRRSNEVTLTASGARAFITARRAAVAASEHVFGGLTDRERTQLDRLLAKVLAHVEGPPTG